MDPQLKRQVEVIRNLVESYMTIVTKSTKDLVPKTITHMIINNTKRFIFEELLIQVYANEDQVGLSLIKDYIAINNFIMLIMLQVNLLEESPEAVRKREEKMAIYQACKAALDIIGDCSLKFGSQPMVTENERIYIQKPSPPSAAMKKSK